MSGPSKLCRNCDHFRRGTAACNRPYKPLFDLVHGAHMIRLDAPAAQERRGLKTILTGRTKCGPTGRYFEKYEPPLPPPAVRGE